MKCPNCDGSGIVNEPIYNKSHTLIKNWAIKKCDICNGSGEYVAEPMTNEEYLKSCDTEQLAEFLTKVILDDKRFRMTMVGGVNETKLWLKQPRTFK